MDIGDRTSFATSRTVDGVCVAAVCDSNANAQRRVKQAYPHVHVTGDCNEILTSPDIDAIAVITPVWTHFELAKKALLNGKYVFAWRNPLLRRPSKPSSLLNLRNEETFKSWWTTRSCSPDR